MNGAGQRLLNCAAVLTILVVVAIFWRTAPAQKLGDLHTPTAQGKLPDKAFTHPPEKPHDPSAYFFQFRPVGLLLQSAWRVHAPADR